MTDYEKEFQKSENVCGEPFEEIVAFFNELDLQGAEVLDLGCGQGRDALMIARLGHKVTGVDISKTGVSQMMEQAEVEGLEVNGVVSDIVTYKPNNMYDIVL